MTAPRPPAADTAAAREYAAALGEKGQIIAHMADNMSGTNLDPDTLPTRLRALADDLDATRAELAALRAAQTPASGPDVPAFLLARVARLARISKPGPM